MARTWSPDNPKAALMARKQAVIVDAALKAFLSAGYAEASVNQIAADAGVSIKTLYRHFQSKDDLFSAVMHAACGKRSSEDPYAPPAWYQDPPSIAFPKAGAEYLRHVLSADQLALYRVVTRDALRFPELGRRYLEETTGGRDTTFAEYLALWMEREGWKVSDWRTAAQAFASLLKVNIYEEALLGIRQPSDEDIMNHALTASEQMLQLIQLGNFASCAERQIKT